MPGEHNISEKVYIGGHPTGHALLYGLQRLTTQALLLPADLQHQVLWRVDTIRLGINTDFGGHITYTI